MNVERFRKYDGGSLGYAPAAELGVPREKRQPQVVQTLNIGLNPSPRFDYMGMTAVSTLNLALRLLSVPSRLVQLVNGDEPTLVVKLTGTLLRDNAAIAALSSKLGQDCIASVAVIPEQGSTTTACYLCGPHAGAYTFNNAAFIEFDDDETE